MTRDRAELYNRINHRVDVMMEEGLLEEVRNVYPYRPLNSLNTVGYKEIFNYLDGTWELPFAIEKIKQNSRIYSRKQMTWFKRDEEIQWFHPDQEKRSCKYYKIWDIIKETTTHRSSHKSPVESSTCILYLFPEQYLFLIVLSDCGLAL